MMSRLLWICKLRFFDTFSSKKVSHFTYELVLTSHTSSQTRSDVFISVSIYQQFNTRKLPQILLICTSSDGELKTSWVTYRHFLFDFSSLFSLMLRTINYLGVFQCGLWLAHKSVCLGLELMCF